MKDKENNVKTEPEVGVMHFEDGRRASSQGRQGSCGQGKGVDAPLKPLEGAHPYQPVLDF